MLGGLGFSMLFSAPCEPPISKYKSLSLSSRGRFVAQNTFHDSLVRPSAAGHAESVAWFQHLYFS